MKRAEGKGCQVLPKHKDYLDWARVIPAFVPDTFMDTNLVYNCCKHVSKLKDVEERNSVFIPHPTDVLHMLTASKKPKRGAYEFTLIKEKVMHTLCTQHTPTVHV